MGMFDKMRAKAEANLSKNDAGEEALARQQEATADLPEAQTTPEPKKDINVVVDDVIAGKYGTGAERFQNLAAEGFDPEEIQSRVNEKLGSAQPQGTKASDTETMPEATPVEQQVEEIKAQDTPETGDASATGDFQVGADASQKEMSDEIPENVRKDLANSDEGQQAQEAVDSKDPTKLQNIVTPDGEAVLKGSYDANGRYVPHVYSLTEASKLQDKGYAGAATIISLAISALGALAGIPIPPINFFKVLGTDKYRDDLNKMEEDYGTVLNEPIKSGETEQKTIEGRGSAYETNAQKAQENPDLYSKETTNEIARSQAAVTGANTQLDVTGQQQEFEARMKELDRDFQKDMAKINTSNQIAILEKQAQNQQEMAKLLNDLDVQKVVKKIAYAQANGISKDDLATWISSEQGTTKLARGLGYVEQGANAVSPLLNLFSFGNSSKDVKLFKTDGRAANSKMLSNAWKTRR